MPTRPPRVYIQRFNTTQVRVEAPATSRRARDGELFFDPETRTLRLGNGVAAGGVILAGPSGDVSSQLVAEQATFTLQADGDVVLEGTIRDAEGNDLLAGLGGGTDTADFAFDTTSNRSTLYMGTNSANATMSLSTSGVEGSAYVEIPGDNAVGNGLNIYNMGTNGRILARATEKIEIRSDNNDILLNTDSGNWTFRADGKLEFPNSTKQDTAIYATGSVTAESVNYIDDYADPIAAGMTSIDLEAQDLSSDDDKIYIQLPFEIKVFGRVITDITVSSNGYIVFEKEFGAGQYYPQSDQNDFLNHVKAPFLSIFGHDNSWQKVWTKATVNQFIVRWEGNTSNSVGFGGSSNLIYNVVFHSGSEQIDVYCVAGTGSTFSFVSNSWDNVYEFNNYPGNAYIIRTSPHLYDANGDITMPAGGSIKARINEDLRLSVTDAINDGYELHLSVNGEQAETTRVALDLDEVRIYTDLPGASKQWRFENDGQMRIPGPIWAYDANVAMYAMDTGSGLTYASLESRSNADNDVFTTIRATPDGAVISTNLDNVAKTWTFNDVGNIVLPGSNVIGTGVVPAVSSNTTSVTNYAYDATGTTVVLTSGDTVDFPSFSGSILVNSYNGGGVTQYLCGGGDGNATAIGSSKVGAVGAMAFNGTIGGYTFTANESGEHCFYVIRTRTGA